MRVSRDQHHPDTDVVRLVFRVDMHASSRTLDFEEALAKLARKMGGSLSRTELEDAGSRPAGLHVVRRVEIVGPNFRGGRA